MQKGKRKPKGYVQRTAYIREILGEDNAKMLIEQARKDAKNPEQMRMFRDPLPNQHKDEG